MPLQFSTSPDLHKIGPTITVKITPSAALLGTLTTPADIAKYDKSFLATLMIDTGASCSMIDEGVAKALGLVNHGKDRVLTPSGERECFTYDINMVFIRNGRTFNNIRVVESDFKEKQGIDGLIGRDVLKDSLLVYQGMANQFTLAF